MVRVHRPRIADEFSRRIDRDAAWLYFLCASPRQITGKGGVLSGIYDHFACFAVPLKTIRRVFSTICDLVRRVRMDRIHGATESCAFVRKLDFAPNKAAFDAAFSKKK